jgi:hypothetical protein
MLSRKILRNKVGGDKIKSRGEIMTNLLCIAFYVLLGYSFVQSKRNGTKFRHELTTNVKTLFLCIKKMLSKGLTKLKTFTQSSDPQEDFNQKNDIYRLTSRAKSTVSKVVQESLSASSTAIQFVKNNMDEASEEVKKSEQSQPIAPNSHKSAVMSAFADNLDQQIHQIIDYRFMRNIGWKYLESNPRYRLAHGYPVNVEICLYNRKTIKASVIMQNGVICDIIEHVPERKIISTPIYTEFVEVPVAAQTNEENTSIHENTVVVADENVLPKESASYDSAGSESITDMEKAKGLATNYLADVSTELNDIANEAVAKGENSFLFKPDVDGGDLVLSAFAQLLVEKLSFKDAEVVGEDIEVFISLDAQADDGNYDFEDLDEEEIKEETDILPSEVSYSASELTSDIEHIIAEDVPDTLLFPSEPTDMIDIE